MTQLADIPDIGEVTSGLGRFIESVIVPLEADNADVLNNPRRVYDSAGAYVKPVVDMIRQTREAAAQAGYYTMFCPPDIGGGGLGYRSMLDVYDYLYRTYGPSRLLPFETVAHWAFGPSELCRHLTPELSEELLGDIMLGKAILCFGMSEPDAGSDAWMMSTRAVRDADGWVVNGTKQWTSYSTIADHVFLFAVTDPEAHRARKGGVSCFLVPMNSPGIVVDSVIKMFGEIGGNEGVVSFSDVHIPKHALVGELDQGFALAMRGVGLGRVYNSARATGLAQWCLRVATEYARERVTFGRPIAEHQAIGFKLADCALDIYGARAASKDLAERLDRGERAIRELALSKAICAEASLRVADRCMQVCGAMGLTNEVGLYAAWHHARAMQLADGSAEILRSTILKRLLLGEMGFA